MPVSMRDMDLEQCMTRWSRMRALYGGEDYLKGDFGPYRPQEFLPEFHDHDDERYKAYVTRAVYYNLTGWTIQGLVGAIFRKGGNIDLPSQVEYAEKNMDGSGLTLDGFSRHVSTEVMTVGLDGLLVDVSNGSAYTKTYKTESILGRKVDVRNGSIVLTMVRLEEMIDIPTDVYTTKKEKQYRVIYLDDQGFCWHRIFDKKEIQVGDDLPVLRADGSQIDYIPFVFCGAENNKPCPDKPPLLDIGFINLGHFRNSADREENLFLHGQGTMVLDTGDVSNSTIKEFYPDGIKVGSRSAIAGPGFSASMLQIEPSGAHKVAMDDKVITMIGLGARFISEQSGNQRVDSVKMDKAQKESGLNTLVSNVEEAIKQCLEWMTDIMGGDTEAVTYEINREFFDISLSAQEATAIVMLGDSGYMAPDDINNLLKKAGWLRQHRTVDEISQESSDNSGTALGATFGM